MGVGFQAWMLLCNVRRVAESSGSLGQEATGARGRLRGTECGDADRSGHSLLSIGNLQEGAPTSTSRSLAGHRQLSLVQEGGTVLWKFNNQAGFSRAKEVLGPEGALERVSKSAAQVFISFDTFFSLPTPFFLFVSPLSCQIVSHAIGALGLGIDPFLKRKHRIRLIGQWGLGGGCLCPCFGLVVSFSPLVPYGSKALSQCLASRLCSHLLPRPRPHPGPAARPSACQGRGVRKRCWERLPEVLPSAPEAVTALFALPAGSFPPWPP